MKSLYALSATFTKALDVLNRIISGAHHIACVFDNECGKVHVEHTVDALQNLKVMHERTGIDMEIIEAEANRILGATA